MRTRKLFLCIYLLAAILLFSCTNTAEKQGSDKEMKKDSLTQLSDGGFIAAHFKTLNELPYSVDTTLLFHLEECDSLGTNEVKQLDKNWFGHDLAASAEYELKTFYKIDSIKAAGKYKEYCDSLEPGNTKSSNAATVCKIKVDENTTILVWSLLTSSYEACPYSVSVDIYFSVFQNGAVVQSFQLGQYISAGDPPVAMRRIVSGKMNKDLTFELNVYEENDEDMDQPELFLTKEHYEFAIKDGKVALLKEKKEPQVKIKRKEGKLLGGS